MMDDAVVDDCHYDDWTNRPKGGESTTTVNVVDNDSRAKRDYCKVVERSEAVGSGAERHYSEGGEADATSSKYC